MTKTVTVQARMEPKLKEQADAILAALGMNATTAITLFYKQVVRQRGLPFELKLPNEDTLAAIEELNDPARRAKLASYTSVEDLMKALEPQAL